MFQQSKLMVKAAIVCGVLATRGIAVAEDGDVPGWEKKPDIKGIIINIPVLKHSFPVPWQPTLFWWQAPLSFSDPKKLKKELQALADRGIQPCVCLEAEYKVKPDVVKKRISEAKAVADAGFPVNIQMIGALDLYALPNGKRIQHADVPKADKKDAVGQTMPCLPIKDGWEGRARHIKDLFRQFKEANVPINAVWYDYEGHPHPWNGIYGHSNSCPSCKKLFPKDALKSLIQFQVWIEDTRAEALQTAFAKPVKEFYPKAKVGFYNFILSSLKNPYVSGCGVSFPPSGVNPSEIDVVMPVCYANTSIARRFFNADWPITIDGMDAVYFTTLLRAVSNVKPNMRGNQMLVPFVTSYCGSKANECYPRFRKAMYREFLRHCLLRGARGFYCFNVAPPYGTMPDYYAELIDINTVYNEFLGEPYREFLDGGEPMNNSWLDPKDISGVSWSGLRKKDKAIIRVVAMGSQSRFVDLVPFAGVAVNLVATPAGNSYLVDKSGKVEAID